MQRRSFVGALGGLALAGLAPRLLRAQAGGPVLRFATVVPSG
jgi:hypothetical protein